MRMCESPAADHRILKHHARCECLHQGLDFHVLELANVEMPTMLPFSPPQEEVTGRLHHPVTMHNPLP